MSSRNTSVAIRNVHRIVVNELTDQDECEK